MTHYEVLGVDALAPQSLVDKAARRSLRGLHDAVHHGPVHERRVRFMALLRVHEAYLALREPNRRRTYDAWLGYDIADPLGSTIVPRHSSVACPICGRTVELGASGSTLTEGIVLPALDGPAAQL